MKIKLSIHKMATGERYHYKYILVDDCHWIQLNMEWFPESNKMNSMFSHSQSGQTIYIDNYYGCNLFQMD